MSRFLATLSIWCPLSLPASSIPLSGCAVFCWFALVSLPSYLCPHFPSPIFWFCFPCSLSMSRIIHPQAFSSNLSSCCPSRSFETSSSQNDLFIPPHTRAGERWKDVVFAGNDSRMFFSFFAQGDGVPFKFYERTAHGKHVAPTGDEQSHWGLTQKHLMCLSKKSGEGSDCVSLIGWWDW